ncbi:MAG: hypothetical protein HN909_07065 [Phycisphaerales bacterium]|jgi:hypothetical protein|nr:hypothetical protein [Phycisphaerales bacterium]MBT7171511.1 hypothetical protein [Phycisphaerales bacterium]
MIASRFRFVALLVALSICVCMIQADTTSEAKTSKVSTETQKRIERRYRYAYALYMEPLASKDRFFRCIAIVGMNKVDTKYVLKPIYDTAMTDKDPIVRAFAFQAMLPRMKDLTDEQYTALMTKALDDARKGYLRGELRVGLFQHLRCFAPNDLKGAVARDFFFLLQKCSHLNPADTPVLIEMRNLMAHWQDKALITRCCSAMTRDGSANKYEFVLGGLNPEIPAVGQVNAKASWTATKATWTKWLRATTLQPKPKADRKTLKATSLLPAPRKIVNPDAPEWNENLEIDKLTIKQFDLAFVMDATGSMGGPMKWVASNLGSLMNMVGLVCSDPRIGVTLFRHELDPSIQAPCCKEPFSPENKPTGTKKPKGKKKGKKKFKPGPIFGCATLFALSGKTSAMASGLARFQPFGGNYLHPGGAVAGGLKQALEKQPWAKGESAKKIIVLIGDSLITNSAAPRSTEVATALATAAKGRGFVIHSLILKGKLPGYVAVAEAGGGKALKAKLPPGFQAGIPKAGFVPKYKTCENGQLIAPYSSDTPFSTLANEIMKTIIPESYHKRIAPLVKVLLTYSKS